MAKNPLRELLNRIKHDAAYDQTLCQIEYMDFEGESGKARVPLILCEIEASNISCSGTVIPFHRITGVFYNSETIYQSRKE